MTLELPRTLEQKLTAEAIHLGMPMDEYALGILSIPRPSPRKDATTQRPSDRRRVVEKIRTLRRQITTGGRSIRSMIEEGRRF